MKKCSFFLAAACLVVLFLFSCGSGDNDSQEKSTQGLTPVSLQLQWVTQTQFAGYYVALSKGWYRDEGLDVTIYPGGPDIVGVDLVNSGARDFGTTLPADLVLAVSGGKNIKSIAQVHQDNGLRLVTRKTSGIRVPEDFIGRKIGVWLGGWEVQFNALLAQNRIDPDSVERVSQGFSMRALLDGRIDAASAMIYNEYLMLTEGGIPESDIHVIDYADYRLDFPGDVIFASQWMIRERPEVCRAFLKASFMGWEYAMEHMDEAVNIVLKHDTSGVAAFDHQKKMMAQIRRLIRGQNKQPLGYTDHDAYTRMISLLSEYKMLASPLSARDVYTMQFVEQLNP